MMLICVLQLVGTYHFMVNVPVEGKFLHKVGDSFIVDFSKGITKVPNVLENPEDMKSVLVSANKCSPL